MQGVYEIRNTVTGEFYIGRSKMIEKRWFDHITDLERERHISPRFQAAWKAYGPNSFTFSVLEIIADYKQRSAREIALINALQPAYNVDGTEYEVERRHERALRIKAQRAQVAMINAQPLPVQDDPPLWLYSDQSATLSTIGASHILGCYPSAVVKLCDSGVLQGVVRDHRNRRRIPYGEIVGFMERRAKGKLVGASK